MSILHSNDMKSAARHHIFKLIKVKIINFFENLHKPGIDEMNYRMLAAVCGIYEYPTDLLELLLSIDDMEQRMFNIPDLYEREELLRSVNLSKGKFMTLAKNDLHDSINSLSDDYKREYAQKNKLNSLYSEICENIEDISKCLLCKGDEKSLNCLKNIQEIYNELLSDMIIRDLEYVVFSAAEKI